MTINQTKYALLREVKLRHNHTYTQVCLLIFLCVISSIAVYASWNVFYKQHINIPAQIFDTPISWRRKAEIYAYAFQTGLKHDDTSIDGILSNSSNLTDLRGATDLQYDDERIYMSESQYKIKKDKDESKSKLICYYSIPNSEDQYKDLHPRNIDPFICTHINIGVALIVNNVIQIDDVMERKLKETAALRHANPDLKILLWVGGLDDTAVSISQMVKNHTTRKIFIKSLKQVLETYLLDGIDLDWEFPSAYNKERQHFSQLLHEIRREYEREHRTYLLSVAVAAPEGIAYFAYDVKEINKYVDYVNIMTYDYYFYSRGSPFTGLNAPLYKRSSESGLISGQNINATVNYWLRNGLDRNKIIIGLPTYGHSFELVNPFNTAIGAPAKGFGYVGSKGFVTYSDVCWFKDNNFFVTTVFDEDTCSPYLYAGTEWISFDNEQSLACKTKFIKDNNFGGVMIFSLNTDDFSSYCVKFNENRYDELSAFPLVRKINSILFKFSSEFDKGSI